MKPRTYRPNDKVEAEITNFSATPQVVGGGTTHWGGMVPRMAESDFKLRSLHGDVPGASLVDWPISYDELEPYYTRVEWEFGTSGLAGANKWEAWRSRGYPTKPSPLSRRSGGPSPPRCPSSAIAPSPCPRASLPNPTGAVTVQ